MLDPNIIKHRNSITKTRSIRDDEHLHQRKKGDKFHTSRIKVVNSGNTTFSFQ